ncbi:MAG: CBS domain-containing protein [Nanoarchaeota archaeon]|nr:CBS domain-containing protein [Nanoarchaeota archaeon]
MITGYLLLDKRKQLCLSQLEVSKKVGISQAHLSKIESSKVDPRLSSVNKLLNLYDNSTKKTVALIMGSSVISARSFDSIRSVAKTMRLHNISQLPIIDSGIVVGKACEEDIVLNLRNGLGKKSVGKIMGHPFPIVHVDEPVKKIKDLVMNSKAVLVSRRGSIVGIVTKYDLLKLVE